MKKPLFAVVLAAGLPFAFAADQTVTGVISDSMCNSNHAMMQNGAKKMSAHECAVACVKAGQKYVLISDKKIYQIKNQSFSGLEKNAGNTVNATGQVSADGDSITVARLSPVSVK